MKNFSINSGMSYISESSISENAKKRLEDYKLEEIPQSQVVCNLEDEEDSFSINDSFIKNELLAHEKSNHVHDFHNNDLFYYEGELCLDSTKEVHNRPYHRKSKESNALNSHAIESLSKYEASELRCNKEDIISNKKSNEIKAPSHRKRSQSESRKASINSLSKDLSILKKIPGYSYLDSNNSQLDCMLSNLNLNDEEKDHMKEIYKINNQDILLSTEQKNKLQFKYKTTNYYNNNNAVGINNKKDMRENEFSHSKPSTINIEGENNVSNNKTMNSNNINAINNNYNNINNNILNNLNSINTTNMLETNKKSNISNNNMNQDININRNITEEQPESNKFISDNQFLINYQNSYNQFLINNNNNNNNLRLLPEKKQQNTKDNKGAYSNTNTQSFNNIENNSTLGATNINLNSLNSNMPFMNQKNNTNNFLMNNNINIGSDMNIFQFNQHQSSNMINQYHNNTKNLSSFNPHNCNSSLKTINSNNFYQTNNINSSVSNSYPYQMGNNNNNFPTNISVINSSNNINTNYNSNNLGNLSFLSSNNLNFGLNTVPLMNLAKSNNLNFNSQNQVPQVSQSSTAQPVVNSHHSNNQLNNINKSNYNYMFVNNNTPYGNQMNQDTRNNTRFNTMNNQKIMNLNIGSSSSKINTNNIDDNSNSKSNNISNTSNTPKWSYISASTTNTPTISNLDLNRDSNNNNSTNNFMNNNNLFKKEKTENYSSPFINKFCYINNPQQTLNNQNQQLYNKAFNNSNNNSSNIDSTPSKTIGKKYNSNNNIANSNISGFPNTPNQKVSSNTTNSVYETNKSENNRSKNDISLRKGIESKESNIINDNYIEDINIETLRENNNLDEYINSKKGSKLLQSYLQGLSKNQVKELFDLVLPFYEKVCSDQYGNYFMTKFIDHLNIKQRKKLWKLTKKNFFEISTNEFGNHCVQALIENIDSPDEEIYINNLVCPYFLNLALNKFGTFILQKILLKFSKEIKSSVERFVRDNFQSLANNIYGVCVIKKYIISNKTASDSFKKEFIDYFCLNFDDIINNQNGNYSVFCLIEEWGLEISTNVIDLLEENVADLGTKKFSQSLISKCLSIGNQNFKEKFSQNLFVNIKDLSSFIDKKRGYILLKSLINYLEANTLYILKKKLKAMKLDSNNYHKTNNTYNITYYNETYNNIKDLLLIVENKINSLNRYI